MKKLKTFFIGILIFSVLFAVYDILFFYDNLIKTQNLYASVAPYLNDDYKKSFYFTPYFIKLKKFRDDYLWYSTLFRPIQNPQSNERSILIFGCSFAYGYVFDNEETISYIMSKYSTRPVINRAMNSWSIQHMLYQLKEDKTFVSSLDKNPKYIFYVLPDYGEHFRRLYFTNMPNIFDREYYFTYKLKNNELIERKPFLNLYYNFSIIRHIYNKFIEKYINKNLFETPNKEIYNFIILHFLEINKQIKNYWGTDDDAPKFIILSFGNNNEEYWRDEPEKDGIKVINITELIEKENLRDSQYGFFEPETASHPNGKLWKEVVPKLKELYPDL